MGFDIGEIGMGLVLLALGIAAICGSVWCIAAVTKEIMVMF